MGLARATKLISASAADVVDKERLVRVLAYLGLLENDMDMFYVLPQEALEEVVARLDCKSLGLICQVSSRFAGLCRDERILRAILRRKGYGPLRGWNIDELKALCTRSGSRHLPGELYFCGRSQIRLGLGMGSNEAVTPTHIPSLDGILQLAVGSNHVLYLVREGGVARWSV